MRAISLFSGAGGFELGFDRAGIETVLQAESDPWCLSVLARHWPHVERVTDVRSVRGDRLRLVDVDTAGATRTGGWRSVKPDLIYGGFPCQDVSVAGNRAGLAGERSGLWSEFRRILCELRPRWFCAENVPGLLSSAGGRDFGQILGDVDELGYGVAWAVLDARHFGVPQRRRRVFIVGCVGDAQRAAQVLVVCESCDGHLASSSETGEGVAFTLAGGTPDTNRGIGNGWNTTYLTDEARPLTERSTGYRMDYETENFLVASPIRASDGHHGHSSPRGDGADNLIAWDDRNQAALDNVHHTLRGAGLQRSDVITTPVSHGVRRLTPLEAERLMGWPDGHTKYTADGTEIPDSHRYRLCGNGVVSTVAEWIGHRLVNVERLAA